MNRLFLSIIISLIFCSVSFAQSPIVEKSAVVETINNKQFYVHTVKKGETIYSLCKAYAITEAELKKCNPGSLIDGISVDQKLLFPYKVTTNKPQSHVVVKGETMYAIGKQYNVSLTDLIKANPSLQNGLSVGQILTIPNPVAATTTKTEEKPKQKESKINSKALYSSTAKVVDTVDNKQTITKSMCDRIAGKRKGMATNIAVILPLYLKANDTTATAEVLSYKDQKIYGKSIPYLEFYEGILLALDSLKKLGISVHMFTYDSNGDSTSIDNIIKDMSKKDIDVIIGPFEQDDFEKVSKYANIQQIPIVCPMATNVLLAKNNPFVMMVNTSQKYRTEAEALSIIHTNGKNAKYIFIHNGHLGELDDIEKMKDYMRPSFDDTLQMNKRVVTLKYNPASFANIEAVFDTSLNIVIIPSVDQAFLNDIISRLNQYKKYRKIELHGMAVWETFNLELDYLFGLHLHYTSSNYRDYTNSNVKHFVFLYRDNFKTEPSKLSFLGFDVAMYFIGNSAKYGKQINQCSLHTVYNGIQTSFSFSQIGNSSGYINTSVGSLEYTADYNRIFKPINFTQLQKKFENSPQIQVNKTRKETIQTPKEEEEEE